MSIFKKIFTAIRGGATEVGESIVDANATRIFEQEIRDAENHLTKAKRDLTEVMAKQMQTSREVSRLKEEIETHEGYASQALDKGDESLALEIAEKIASLETEFSTQQQTLESLNANVSRLKDLIKKSERQVADFRRQLSVVKTTDSVHKATAAITDNFVSGNSKLLNAKESLERIKAKQQNYQDRMQAAEQLQAEQGDGALEAKLKAAGIGEEHSSASSVLARIKAKQ
ncbi:PspA/IM30 family protein [Gayadomonas joobiniege]|uniref:PspA/IM30 family protein n=1 Tax=Gayadomonas joobiniege TaxID=1234606 RepID=UPI0003767395|nr:PspA/IM30 family protein [Gayadomonas joobiniege]